MKRILLVLLCVGAALALQGIAPRVALSLEAQAASAMTLR